MSDLLRLEFKSTLESMVSAMETAARWLAGQGASGEIQSFTQLAIEELATNCMKYGYDDATEHALEVELTTSNNELVMTFSDDGRPFDPLQVPSPDLEIPAEERCEGGLGVYLLRQMSDRMEYAREGARNKVTLRKRLKMA